MLPRLRWWPCFLISMALMFVFFGADDSGLLPVQNVVFCSTVISDGSLVVLWWWCCAFSFIALVCLVVVSYSRSFLCSFSLVIKLIAVSPMYDWHGISYMVLHFFSGYILSLRWTRIWRSVVCGLTCVDVVSSHCSLEFCNSSDVWQCYHSSVFFFVCFFFLLPLRCAVFDLCCTFSYRPQMSGGGIARCVWVFCVLLFWYLYCLYAQVQKSYWLIHFLFVCESDTASGVYCIQVVRELLRVSWLNFFQNVVHIPFP